MVHSLSSVLYLLATFATVNCKDDRTLAEELFKWIEANGGKVGFQSGRECATCPRGVFATQDFKKGDVIAEFPYKIAVQVGRTDEPSAEGAVDLIRKRFENPQHNKTYATFWATQPGVDEVLTPDLFTDELIDMLQSDALEEVAREHRTYTESVYHGEAGKYEGRTLVELLGGAHLSLEQFKWYTALIVSRAFSLQYAGGGEEGGPVDGLRTYLVPGLDLINHADEGQANCQWWQDTERGLVAEVAARDIRKGEQLYHMYYDGFLHRPDMSLLVYGFVSKRDPPLLAAADLPGFDVLNPFQHTPPNDDAHTLRGEHATFKELTRLLDIKNGWPTSLEQDQELLEKEGGKGNDWRKRTLLQYRVQRKQAVNNVVNSLQEALGEL